MRTFLTAREAGFLLQMPEMKVRRMVDTGGLRLVIDSTDIAGRRRLRLDPESVRQRFPRDGSYELRRLALQAILAGRVKVPTPTTRWGLPRELAMVVALLDARWRGDQ